MGFYEISKELFSPKECLSLFDSHTFPQETIDELYFLISSYAKENEEESVIDFLERVEQKYHNKRRIFAFCGHFSAGKSTLMNQLIGKQMLPSHPIPTSANVVHMKKGEKVTFSYEDKEKGAFITLSEEEWDEDLFTDNERADDIYITLPHEHLPENVELLDTPGIDSTDVRHRKRAESRLKEADVIYYVVDYQHVESEENFQFLKELNSQYMFPILIINQMDKHNENEMKLKTFQQQLEESLQKHDILLKDIYFISALSPDLYRQHWEKLLQDIYSEKSHNTLEQTAALCLYRALKQIAKNVENRFTPSEKELFHMNRFQTLKQLQHRLEEMKETIQRIPKWPLEIEKAMFMEVEKVFQNAKLTPYHTRNLIYNYLESRQASFRLKGLFTKQKTKAEKNKRLKQLLNSLNENVRNYIHIHLHEGLERILSSYSMDDRKTKQMIQQIEHEVDEAILKQSERKGALFSQEYVLMYSRFLTDTIRKKYKESVIHLFQQIEKNIARVQLEETERLQKEFDFFTTLAKNWQRWEKSYDKMKAILENVHRSLHDKKKPFSQRNVTNDIAQQLFERLELKRTTIDLAPFYKEEREVTKDFEKEKINTFRAVETVMETLRSIGGFENLLHSLQKRKARLENKTFRISLFGSFSTGKSSIANALLGEKILPTAANPTTASVQYIKYPTEKHPHKTVVINFKTEADVVSDMNDILRPASVSLTQIEDWPHLVEEREKMEAEKQKEKKNEKEENIYHPLDLLYEEERSRLQDYYDSFTTYRPLATTQIVSLQEYETLAQSERRAMLMKDVTIYFDCPFTKEGYELTDTPGVGSIYRRHSEVAFNEMKHADAILFVSYYNHSFSKGDWEFLLQLGRIQNYFSYDKMFFLVNAADLAKSNEEVSEVLQYVKNELTYFGLQSPRVFPLSGKMALEENAFSQSGFEGFLQTFRSFRAQTLEKVVIQALQAEIKNVYHSLQERLRSFNLEEEERKSEMGKAIRHLKQFHEKVKKYKKEEDLRRIKRELEELLFYVKQRVFYRFYDEFKEQFAIVQFDNSHFEAQLERATNDMIHFVFHQLTEEIRATVIRMEYFIQTEWEEIQQELLNELPESLRAVFVTKELSTFPEVRLKETVPIQSRNIPLLKRYNSYTDFFIENKKELFKEQLESYLRPYGDQYIEAFHQLLEEAYIPYMEREIETYLEELTLEGTAASASYEKERFTETDACTLQEAVKKIEEVTSHL